MLRSASRWVGPVGALSLLPFTTGHAHGVTEQAQQQMLNGNFWEVAWVGAEHMLTGYDHLLFLLGVLLLLTRPLQIVSFITAFTLGHTVTLLGATLAGIRANPFLIDAAIALTVAYKAVENLDGFRRWLGVQQPRLIVMVFVFGLVHGFGLSTRLQSMTIARDPELVSKILAFNVGVEVGQLAALAVMMAAVRAWHDTRPWPRIVRYVNGGLMGAAAVLLALQIGLFISTRTA